MVPRTLYFEPGTGGHRADFLGTVLCHGFGNWVVACPSRLADELPSDARTRLDDKAARGQWIRLDTELSGIPDTTTGRWSLSLDIARRSGCMRVFHPVIDDMLLAAVRLPQAKDIRVAGTFFRPTMHYDRHPSVRDRVQARLKSLLLGRFLARRDVAAVLSLDRYLPDFGRTRYRHVDKLVHLPDLVPVPDDLIARARAGAAPPDPQRRRFILFGALQRRKGGYQVLDAVARLPAEVAGRVDIRFCGKVPPESADLPDRIAALNANSPARLVLDNRFLPLEELAVHVAAADVVLAPYQNHKGSSGLLYWAAAFGKPVIAQDYGLVGREAREYGLGTTVASGDVNGLAEAIARAAAPAGLTVDPAGMARFIDGHSARTFGETISRAVFQPEIKSVAETARCTG